MYGMDSSHQQSTGWNCSSNYNVDQNLHYAKAFPYELENKSCIPCDSNSYWISSQSYDCGRTAELNHQDKPPIPKLTIKPVRKYPKDDKQGTGDVNKDPGYLISRGPLSRRGHHSRPFPSPRLTSRDKGRPVECYKGIRPRGSRPVVCKETHCPGKHQSNDNDDISALKTNRLFPSHGNESKHTNQTLLETHNADDAVVKVNCNLPKDEDIKYSSEKDGHEDSTTPKENAFTLQSDQETMLPESSQKEKANVDGIGCEFDTTTTSYCNPFSNLRKTRIRLSDLPLSTDKLEFALQKMYPDIFSRHIQVKVKKLHSSKIQDSETHISFVSPVPFLAHTPSLHTNPNEIGKSMSCDSSCIDTKEQDATYTNSDASAKETLRCPNAVSCVHLVEDSTSISNVPHFDITKLKSKLKSVTLSGPLSQQSIATQSESFAFELPEITNDLPNSTLLSDESPRLICVSETCCHKNDFSDLSPPVLEPIDYTTVDTWEATVGFTGSEDHITTYSKEKIDKDDCGVLEDTQEQSKIEEVAKPDNVSSLTASMFPTNNFLPDGAQGGTHQAQEIQFASDTKGNLTTKTAIEYSVKSDSKMEPFDNKTKEVQLTEVHTNLSVSMSMNENMVSTEDTSPYNLTQYTMAACVDSVVTNGDSIKPTETCLSYAGSIGVEYSAESGYLEDPTTNDKNEANTTVDAGNHCIKKAEAESAVVALICTLSEDITANETAEGESNYDSEGSDATVRYSDDEDDNPHKANILQKENEHATGTNVDEKTADSTDTVSTYMTHRDFVDTNEKPAYENRSDSETSTLSGFETPCEGLKVPQIPETWEAHATKEIKDFSLETSTVNTNTNTSDTTKEPVVMQTQKQVRDNPKRKHDKDIFEFSMEIDLKTDKITRPNQSVNGSSTLRSGVQTKKRQRRTVAKRLRRGKKKREPYFPDIKSILDGVDKHTLDEDELPTILPPKRRRLKISSSLKSATPVGGMDRLTHEFPHHNWLENKYKIEAGNDQNDNKATSPKPNNSSPQHLENVTEADVTNDTNEMEVSTTTPLDEFIDTDCSETQHLENDTISSDTIRDVDGNKDDTADPSITPLDLCVKPLPKQSNRVEEDIKFEHEETSKPKKDYITSPIITNDGEHSDLSGKTYDADQLNENIPEHFHGKVDISGLSYITPSTNVRDRTERVYTSYSMAISNNNSISSTVIQDPLRVVNTVSSTSTTGTLQKNSIQLNRSFSQDDTKYPMIDQSRRNTGNSDQMNKTNARNTCQPQHLEMSAKPRDIDKEVYKHLREYQQIQICEARMEKERTALIRLKNEKANLLSQLGIREKFRHLNGGHVDIRPVNGNPSLSLDVTASRGIQFRDVCYKQQAESYGKHNNALHHRDRHHISFSHTRKERSNSTSGHVPVHIDASRKIVKRSNDSAKCKGVERANIDASCSFMKKIDPLTMPPFQFPISQPSTPGPPRAHSQTPFQSAGQLIYPLPSFLEHKTRSSRRLSSESVTDRPASTKTNNTGSPDSCSSDSFNNFDTKPVVCNKGKVQTERRQDIKHVSIATYQSIHPNATSHGNSVHRQQTRKSQILDKRHDTEDVVQRELNEALAKRQRIEDPKSGNQKTKVKVDRPPLQNIAPKTSQRLHEEAKELMKVAERKQQQNSQRVGQREQPKTQRKIQNEMAMHEEKGKQLMFNKQQQDGQQEQQWQQQQEQQEQQRQQQLLHVQQHIYKRQQKQREQQNLQQHHIIQQQPQPHIIQQFQQQSKPQTVHQHIPNVPHSIFSATNFDVNTSQVQMQPQNLPFGNPPFMTSFCCQNVNHISQTQWSNRCPIPVNVSNQMSSNIHTAGLSCTSGNQGEMMVLKRHQGAIATIPQTSKNDHSQQVLGREQTVPMLSNVSGSPTIMEDKHQLHGFSKPVEVSSNLFPVMFQQTDVHGHFTGQISLNTAFKRYPVCSAFQNHNVSAPVVEMSSNSTPILQNKATHHKQVTGMAENDDGGSSTVAEGVQNTNGFIMQSPGYTHNVSSATKDSPSMVSQQTAPELQQIKGSCKVCGKSAVFLCSSCKRIWYCSEACQLNHWVSHAHECEAITLKGHRRRERSDSTTQSRTA